MAYANPDGLGGVYAIPRQYATPSPTKTAVKILRTCIQSIGIAAVDKVLVPNHFITLNPSPGLRWPAALMVVAAHLLVVWGLWQAKQSEVFHEEAPLFVSLIEPAPPRQEIAPLPPKPPVSQPRVVETPPEPAPIVAESPMVTPSDYAVPAPPPVPESVVVAPEPVPAAQPVTLPELSATCPGRTPPVYPLQARRMGREGRVLLQVFLDESGHVARALVQQSSGVTVLDEAALKAVQQWQCNPALRNGQPVAAVALQPFNFTLRRN